MISSLKYVLLGHDECKVIIGLDNDWTVDKLSFKPMTAHLGDTYMQH